MKIIDRYLSKEIALTAGFAIVVLSLVLVLGNVFKQVFDLLVNHDVPLEYIASFVGYILPFSLTFSIPWGFLTSVLLVFGKMSAENEIIALRAQGVSIVRLCAPLLFLAIGCTLLCLWINVDVAPRAQTKMKSALFNIATSNPIAMFGNDEVIDEFPGKKIYVGKKNGNDLEQVFMYELAKNGDPLRVVYAQHGKIESDLANKQVLLHLYDARYEQREENAPWDLAKIRQGITMEQGVLPISLQELYEKNQKRRGLSQMTVGELLSVDNKIQRSTTLTEVSKRVAFSIASLALALIGVPLAITAQRKETSIGFLFSLVIAFVYFFFNIVVDATRNRPNWHPEYLIWVPNIIFIALGVVLFVRLSRK